MKTGDVVVLKSGGPKMTIRGLGNNLKEEASEYIEPIDDLVARYCTSCLGHSQTERVTMFRFAQWVRESKRKYL